MGTKVCSKCGKLFFSNGNNLCVQCLEVYQKEEDIVFDYLRKRKAEITIEQLSKETEVPLDVLMDMFYHDRFIGDYVVTSPCEVCGERIRQGKLCKKCASKLCSGY